jgi:hypothetical protein
MLARMKWCGALEPGRSLRLPFTAMPARALSCPASGSGRLLLSLVLAGAAAASERAVVRLTCPLDGTGFEAIQDFSGFAEGQRLDLKKTGPISQPPALARCPQCGLPLFTKHPTAAEIARLRMIVAGERFRTEARPATPWFALGVLREELQADAFEIGWTYLQASWETEDEGGDYVLVAQRALTWLDRAAADLRDKPERLHDHLIARYLGVELCRRLARFDEAQQRLDQLGAAPANAPRWLARARAEQARLIAAHDSRPDSPRDELPRPPR